MPSLARSDYHEYFAPDFSLNVTAHKVMEDGNSKADVERIRRAVFENLRHLAHAPSVQMHDVPPDAKTERCDCVWGGRCEGREGACRCMTCRRTQRQR
eukprot:282594-Chlamydomonas_euryale.AAC.1